MSALEVPVNGITLDQLEEYLNSDRSPPDSMQLSELDGFLTGLAVGPSVVMPSEWLPSVWRGEEPTFADDNETRAVLGGMMSRYNDILRGIENGTPDPIFWESGEIVIAADWAEGFFDAMKLRWEEWQPLFRSKKHADILFPVLALCGDENGDSLLGFDAETEDKVIDAVTPAIPEAIVEIAAFWRRRKPSSGGIIIDSPATGPVKVGRNAPCLCGSGKKFKKCCGQQLPPRPSP